MSQYDNYMIGNLPIVDDPEKALNAITTRDYNRYIDNFRGFEERLLESRNSTKLIDQAREDSVTQARIAKESSARNRERYGGAGLSAAQRQEQTRAFQRGTSLATADNINNARIQQREVNQATMADLMNIGQGVNRNSLGMLQDAAGMQQNRYQAYKNARSNYSSQMKGMGSQIGSALLGAFLI